jgi:hypothetical protein
MLLIQAVFAYGALAHLFAVSKHLARPERFFVTEAMTQV